MRLVKSKLMLTIVYLAPKSNGPNHVKTFSPTPRQSKKSPPMPTETATGSTLLASSNATATQQSAADKVGLDGANEPGLSMVKSTEGNLQEKQPIDVGFIRVNPSLENLQREHATFVKHTSTNQMKF